LASSTEEKIEKAEYEWQAEIVPIDYELRIKTAEGTVESSVYQAALDNDIDERAIIELANAFQWSIDFAMDPRKGDTFKFVYEERYLDGEYVMPGKILAAEYINNGYKYKLYYFEENEENKGYFDEDGNSAQKMFLKAPVAFKYISSGYTTGTRVVMEIGLSGPHRAIDYAAAIGTPIRAVGDGTVTFAGWSSVGYGYLTSIRHNGTYSTNYAHQSKIAVRVGQKVKQGDIIGYVGSTGYSTGPHLHYEMVKHGAKIDPLKEILPPGKPIAEENQERFFSEKAKYDEMLDS
jgi:murein DD-endopeptidase MepM/ murein hydrolase activator NlpD